MSSINLTNVQIVVREHYLYITAIYRIVITKSMILIYLKNECMHERVQ